METDERIGIDGGYYGIYDGVIIWLHPDGSVINVFAGEGSKREAATEKIVTAMRAFRDAFPENGDDDAQDDQLGVDEGSEGSGVRT